MSKPSITGRSPLHKSFGIGPNVSPYKEGEETDDKTTDKTDKTKKTTKEYGKGDAKKGDKGWVKGLKAATTMLSAGIASVYGGTAHNPKINWGKRKDEIKDDDVIDPETIVDDTLDGEGDTEEETPEMDFSDKAEGDAFRAWVNKTYPDKAKEMDLDASGSHSNSYIKKAFKEYGGEYNKSLPTKMLTPLKARQSSRGGKHAGRATKTAKRRGGFAKSTGKRGAGGRNVGGYNVQTRFKPRATQPIKGGVTKSPGDGGKKEPYSFGPNGDIIINLGDNINTNTNTNTNTSSSSAAAAAAAAGTGDGKEWVPPKFETTTSKHESYKEAWERKKSKYTTTGQKSRMGTDENAYNKFKNIDEYIDYMERVKEYNKTEEGKEWSKSNRKSSNRTTTKRVKTADGYWRTIPGGGGDGNATAEATAVSGAKFKGKFNYGGYQTMHGK